MPNRQKWLPNPKQGTQICVGFDGSQTDDWTVLKAITRDGFLFTPRFGPDRRPTIWNPKEFGGQIPREQVHVAVAHIFSRWQVARMYCDPEGWYSEIGDWSRKYGEKRVVEWATNREKAMHEAIIRFETDLRSKRVRHDGCPLTTTAVGNTMRYPKNNQRIGLGKPIGEKHRKIDPSIGSILANEAAGDVTADPKGWQTVDPGVSHAMYTFS